MIHKSQKTSSRYLRLLVSLSVMFAMATCNSSATKDHSSTDGFAASLSEKDIDLNTGLTIQKSFPAEQGTSELVSLIVLNHTEEDIVFENSGFGLLLFCQDKKTESWRKQNMPEEFFETNRIIPAKTETLDFMLIDINLVDVLQSTVSQISCTQLRLFVQGIGQTTDQKYGAYTDLTIAP
jgi:hypothetical protein